MTDVSTWSSNLVSGGCQVGYRSRGRSQCGANKQDLFTVIPSEQYDPFYNLAGLRCRSPTVSGSWVPPAEKLLEVKIEGPSGAVSEVGWPACCT